jgi:sarcosine oxidase
MFDVIVIGCGGVGSAVLSELSRRGARVLGIDRFAPGHDRGSSHGTTRIIRRAYFEHPDYVPLLLRSYELWARLEDASSQRLFHRTGLLQIGPPDGELVPGVLRSAAEHGLAVQRLDGADVSGRFGGFVVPDGFSAVFEEGAGYLLVEDAVVAQLDLAAVGGAELSTGETVVGWSDGGAGVTVDTDRGHYEAGRLVITAGPWAPQLLAGLGVELRVVRKYQHWFANDDPRYRAAVGAPVFIHEVPAGFFYGFPQIDELGVKVGEHSGGAPVQDPSHVDRSLDAADQDRVARFLGEYLPGVGGAPTDYAVCMYTMSPDEHFIVDRIPGAEHVFFAAGLSGHGFKFTPVLGELLADLALEGKSDLPARFLSLERFGV